MWQIMRQNPSAFEFNEYFLIFLVDQAYSGRFGTFLYESEKERRNAGVATKTPSLWDFVMLHKAIFINPLFHVVPTTLYVNTRATHMALWENYYFRWRRSFVFEDQVYDRASKVLWRAKERIRELEKQVADLQRGGVQF